MAVLPFYEGNASVWDGNLSVPCPFPGPGISGDWSVGGGFRHQSALLGPARNPSAGSRERRCLFSPSWHWQPSQVVDLWLWVFLWLSYPVRAGCPTPGWQLLLKEGFYYGFLSKALVVSAHLLKLDHTLSYLCQLPLLSLRGGNAEWGCPGRTLQGRHLVPKMPCVGDSAGGKGRRTKELGERQAGANDLRTHLTELQFICKHRFIFPIITS